MDVDASFLTLFNISSSSSFSYMLKVDFITGSLFFFFGAQLYGGLA